MSARVPLRALIALLALASLLRLILVVQGGQLYWPDERLYTQVLDIIDLHRGHTFDIVKALVSTQDHIGFALLCAAPAAFQYELGHAFGRSGNEIFELMGLAGVILAQASVVSIALVYAIALRAGRDRVEALVAAVLMASATTMLYYARHLLPYDSSLALALLALWCGVGTRRRDSIGCGAAASAAFITYNGYWLLVGVVLLMHVAHQGAGGRGQGAGIWDLGSGIWDLGSGIRRAVFAGIGFLLVPAAIMLVELATGAPMLFTGMRRLAGTVTDGYAPEGFSLPWAYLWHAEHGLLLVWMAAVIVILFGTAAWNARRLQTARLWVIAAGAIYLGLGFSSAFMHVFVVMGRQSRQVVPFLCLAAAAAAAEWLDRRPRASWLVAACAVALGLQVGWNFRQPLQQRFPRDVVAEITAKYGPVDFENSIQGPPLTHEHVESQWVLLNAQHLYHPRAPRPPLPASVVEVMRFPHPLQFLPYQYEGFEPMERQVLRANDIAMRLLDVGVPVDRLP